MEAVVSFRPFRIPKPADTAFFTPDNSINESFMREDLSRSGLLPEDLQAYTSAFLKKDGATAAYSIPYFNLDGKPIVDGENYPVMYRTRLKFPEFSKEQRYTQPNKETLLKYDLPSYVPYFHPLSLSLKHEYVVCCEGEKKAVAVSKRLGIPTFGIGGCQMWRNPDGTGAIHPWIRKFLAVKETKRILIIPDGDVLRYDICNAYGTYAAALRAEGYDVELLHPQGKIDDLLVLWGANAQAAFADLPKLDPKDLVQSPTSLAKRYNLAFKQDDKGRVTVHQHTSNVMKLMEEHEAFPKVWRNTDNNRIMIGEAQAQPGLTEMDIANYFQHNLGFEKVTNKNIISCIEALAKRNSRSPMLDHIRSLEWDKQFRLDSWMIRHWGVKDEAFIREVSAKWLISACARMDKPGSKIDWMMIVVGPQATGKTTMPSLMFNGNSITMYGEQNDKDLHMLLHSALVVGFDELDSFGKRESSNLKAMITRNEDAFRPPYGASVEIFPRRFTLYGCGNRYEFLQHDPSGYRRYAVVEVSKLLDFGGLEAERDQLWAEAWSRYQAGVKYWEVEGTSEHAKAHVVPNVTEEQINNVIESWKMNKATANVKDGYVFFTMTQLLAMMDSSKDAKNTQFTREVAAIIRGLGAESFNGTAPTGTIRGRYYRVPI